MTISRDLNTSRLKLWSERESCIIISGVKSCALEVEPLIARSKRTESKKFRVDDWRRVIACVSRRWRTPAQNEDVLRNRWENVGLWACACSCASTKSDFKIVFYFAISFAKETNRAHFHSFTPFSTSSARPCACCLVPHCAVSVSGKFHDRASFYRSIKLGMVPSRTSCWFH